MNKNENHIPVFFAAIKLCFLICIGIGMAIFLAEFAGIQSSWLKRFMPVLLSAVICAALVLFLPSKLSCMLIAGGLWLAFVWINKTAIYGLSLIHIYSSEAFCAGAGNIYPQALKYQRTEERRRP